MKNNLRSLAMAIALSVVIPGYGQGTMKISSTSCEEEAYAMASKNPQEQMDWVQCVSESQEADATNILTSTVRVRLVAQSSQEKNQNSSSAKASAKSSEDNAKSNKEKSSK